MIMIIICIAQIASSLGRMTLPFCEHNRESLIRALAAARLPAKRGGSHLAPPVRRQTPDWPGLFLWMTAARVQDMKERKVMFPTIELQ